MCCDHYRNGTINTIDVNNKNEKEPHTITILDDWKLGTEKPVVFVSGLYYLFSEIGNIGFDYLIYGTLLKKRPNNTTAET